LHDVSSSDPFPYSSSSWLLNNTITTSFTSIYPYLPSSPGRSLMSSRPACLEQALDLDLMFNLAVNFNSMSCLPWGFVLLWVCFSFVVCLFGYVC